MHLFSSFVYAMPSHVASDTCVCSHLKRVSARKEVYCTQRHGDGARGRVTDRQMVGNRYRQDIMHKKRERERESERERKERRARERE